MPRANSRTATFSCPKRDSPHSGSAWRAPGLPRAVAMSGGTGQPRGLSLGRGTPAEAAAADVARPVPYRPAHSAEGDSGRNHLPFYGRWPWSTVAGLGTASGYRRWSSQGRAGHGPGPWCRRRRRRPRRPDTAALRARVRAGSRRAPGSGPSPQLADDPPLLGRGAQRQVQDHLPPCVHRILDGGQRARVAVHPGRQSAHRGKAPVRQIRPSRIGAMPTRCVPAWPGHDWSGSATVRAPSHSTPPTTTARGRTFWPARRTAVRIRGRPALQRTRGTVPRPLR